MSGKINMSAELSGTMKDLVADVKLRAADVKPAGVENLSPADATIGLALRDHRLNLTGVITQRDIKPLTIKGSLPFDLAELRKSKGLDKATPISLEVNLPRTSLSALATFVPAIRFINGTAEIDAKIAGTIGRPEMSGAVQADIRDLRFRDTKLPPVSSVNARIDLTREAITIRQFRGVLAGGSFGASGDIRIQDLAAPVLDLRVTARNALLLQDDTITARMSGDVAINGPLSAGTVTGKVQLTKSRFLKDIDILPIGLPGRPAPKPPQENTAISFSEPPLRDWKFDVAIQTLDPFLIQGNLANGKAEIDLRLLGTGLRPWLEGSVNITQLMTSLPYSRAEVTTGNIYFSQAKPFVPELDIRGESLIRDYRITVYIYGTPSEPQAVFTSEPPLPQSEIVSLIATGATTKELTGDPNVLAGRAEALLAQKIIGKLFKRRDPALKKDTPFKDVQFDVGMPDPRSGEQSLQVRWPLGENVVLSGGVDVGGNFRGQIKYLVRFK